MGDRGHTNEGASLSADRIVFQARKLDGIEVFQMTGNHKGTRGKLSKNAYAVIDRQFTNTSASPTRQRGARRPSSRGR